MTAQDGLRTGGVLVVRAPVAARPENPPPPFGKSCTDRTIVVAPANISVISARYRPERRSAGSPTSVPIAHVIPPAMSRSTGNGSAVAYAKRAPIQQPIVSSAIWPSEIIPTRP